MSAEFHARRGPFVLYVSPYGLLVAHGTSGAAIVLYDVRDLERLRNALTEYLAGRACNGNHPAPRCGDPDCWQGEDTGSSGAPMNTGGK